MHRIPNGEINHPYLYIAEIHHQCAEQYLSCETMAAIVLKCPHYPEGDRNQHQTGKNRTKVLITLFTRP